MAFIAYLDKTEETESSKMVPNAFKSKTLSIKLSIKNMLEDMKQLSLDEESQELIAESLKTLCEIIENGDGGNYYADANKLPSKSSSPNDKQNRSTEEKEADKERQTKMIRRFHMIFGFFVRAARGILLL